MTNILYVDDYVTNIFLFIPGVASQTNEYVVLYLENEVLEADVQQSVELYVASRSQTAVTVTIDNPNGSVLSGSNAIASFTLSADEVRMFDIPNTARQTSELGYKAIRVTADGGDVIVYALNRNLYSTDGLTVFNTEQVGTEYYALAYTPSEFNTQIGMLIQRVLPGLSFHRLTVVIPQMLELIKGLLQYY